MFQIRRIVNEFQSSEIETALLIDDAYDPPEIDDSNIGSLIDFLESEVGRTVCTELDIKDYALELAITAAHEGKNDNEDLLTVFFVLYRKFVETNDQKYDPGGHFQNLKGAALEALSPLFVFLKQCQVKVVTAGRRDGRKCYLDFRPQVLFLDCYLDPGITATGRMSGQKSSNARQVSIDLLKEIIEDANDEGIPATVLMSSRKVKQHAQKFRKDAGAEEIMSLRFGYLQKDWIRMENGEIRVENNGAEVLLDTSQGYLFGKFIQQALTKWKDGAKLALSELLKRVDDLDIRDFAYLLRFRLKDEGQPLSEYLEWFFGEWLKSLIRELVDWNHESFSKLDRNQTLEEKIEGAFQGPTINVANFFHRIKVNDQLSGIPKRNQLGDLYVQLATETVWAIITPDCDLMGRKNDPKNILTMRGELKRFDKDGSADDFFLHKEEPYSVRWKPKDLMTFPKDGKESLGKNEALQFLGTLQPLYALHMQRQALVTLSRIGLNTSPALSITATAKVWIRKKNGSFEQIKMKSLPRATIIPPREGQSARHVMLLQRPFVDELITKLNEIDPVSMSPQDANLLTEIQNGQGIDKIYEGYLRPRGPVTKGILGTGFVIGTKADTKQDSLWLQIVLTIPEEAMEDYQANLLTNSADESESADSKR